MLGAMCAVHKLLRRGGWHASVHGEDSLPTSNRPAFSFQLVDLILCMPEN